MNNDKYSSYLNVKLELWETYHNHKENMSNAGFLVQLSLFGAIISKGLWPPKWVSNVTDLPELGTFSVYFMLWFLVHYYMRWQLINKRIAAMYFAGYDKSFLYLTTNDLIESDVTICSSDSHDASPWRDFISKILYIPGGFVKMDASVNGLPEFIAREVRGMFKSGSGANSLEILMTYASIILMIIVGTKVFLG
jgi:hypothetical protein